MRNDGFERGGSSVKKAPDLAPPPNAPAIQSDQKFNDMLRQTRGDPKALQQLAATLNLSFTRFSNEFSADKTKAAALLDQLATAKFSGAALDQLRGELASLRERMTLNKQRMAIQKRRLRGLKQLAGRVSDSRLPEEMAGIEARMEMLETGWAESFVGLGLGKVIYTPDNDETPEHLKKVVKTNVGNTKKNQDAEALAELLSELHPGRVVTQVAARELDQKKKKLSEKVLDKVRKEQRGPHGRTVQAFAALYELFEHDLDEDK
jgi:hypothetical protein